MLRALCCFIASLLHTWASAQRFGFSRCVSLSPVRAACQGDIVLVGLRDYQDEKADVILKYMADEARSLKAYGEQPESIRVNETDTFDEERGENDDYFDFDEVSEI